MKSITFAGFIKNDHCDIKTLVLAENADAAKAKVLDVFKKGLGKTYVESDVRIVQFADVA